MSISEEGGGEGISSKRRKQAPFHPPQRKEVGASKAESPSFAAQPCKAPTPREGENMRSQVERKTKKKGGSLEEN